MIILLYQNEIIKVSGKFMLIVFIALLILAFILFMSDRKSESNRYASLVILFLSMRPAADSFKTHVIPIIEANQTNLLDFSLLFNEFLYTISTYFTFYFILLYSISYSGILKFKHPISKFILKVILLAPSILTYLFVPITSTNPHFSTNYILLLIWTTLYAIFSNALMINAYFKEKHTFLKTERLINMFFIIPIQTIFIISEVIIPIFKPTDIEYLNKVPIFYLSVYFLFFTTKLSFLGFRNILQKRRRSYEKKIFDSSMSIFKNSFKNEISKISLYSTLLKNYSNICDNEEEETLDTIMDSSYNLLDMINKMSFHAQEIVLHTEYVELKELIYKVIALNRRLLAKKEIELYLAIHDDLNIYCDKIHFTELLNNIIKNALEALKSNGIIEIKTELINKYLTISIKDNGYGVPESNIKKVTEPFFSTKNSKGNYGLGLYYCKNVIESHGGFIEIKGIKNTGTEVHIFLPSNRVLPSYSTKSGSVHNGSNKNRYCRR